MRILIADDSATMRAMIRRALRQSGFDADTTVEVGDGAAVVKITASEKFDLILLDWNMPNMNAADVLRVFVARGLTTPVVLVTTEGSEEMRRRAAALGAPHVISKPFTDDVFRSVLGAALRGVRPKVARPP